MSHKLDCGRITALAVAVCAVVLFLAPALLAQIPTGTILGVVKDASGAVVPGAMVTVTNSDTGASRTAMTEADGAYRFSALPVGNYDIQVAHAGFNTQTQKGFVLQVAQEAVLNITLEVGSTTQAVEVTEQAPVVETTEANLGGVVTEEKIEDLPLNGRNYLDLMLFQPGVNHVAPQVDIPTVNGLNFVSNGATPRSNNFMLDGAILTNSGGANSASVTGTSLGLDGIQEFKVITSLFSAEYPLTMGSQTVMVSKGGTNQLHGSAFEYVRNDVLDAANFFDVTKSALSRNQFGGSLGGPIKKNKTFIFGNFEGVKQTQGLTSSSSEHDVPEAGCRGPAGAVIWNGQGVQPAGSLGPCPQLGQDPALLLTVNGVPTPGAGPNYVTMSKYTAELLALVPLPNVKVGQGINPVTGQTHGDIFAFPHVQPTSEYFGQVRVDHTFSDKDSLFGRYTIDNARQVTPGNWPGLLGGGGGGGGTLSSRSQFITVAENHLFSTNVVNTVRLSFSRPTLTSAATGSSGQNGLPDYRNSSLLYPLVSCCWPTVGSFGASGWSDGISNYPLTVQGQNIYTLSDDVFWNKGKHAFKFGVLLNRYNQPLDLTLSVGGSFGTTSLAAFDEGMISRFAITPPAGTNLNKDYLYNTYGFYLQDDWRLTKRLTLNLGLRYEFRGPIGMLDFKTKSFAFLNFPLPFINNGALSGKVDAGSCVGTLIPNCVAPASGDFSGTTQGTPLQNPTLHNFSPRIGFAWDPFGDGKTAVRGGFGMYYDLANAGSALTNDSYGTPPTGYQSQWSSSPVIPLIPLCLPIDTCFPIPTPQTAPAYPYPFAGTTLSSVDYHAKQPYMFEYNLSIERQLPGQIGLTVAYVGSRGIHLWSVMEGNPAVPDQVLDSQNPECASTAAILGFPVPANCTAAGVSPRSNTPGGLTFFDSNCPAPGPLPVFINPNDVNPADNAINPNACRVNPYYGDYTLYTTTAASWYNSLQVEVKKNLGHGLEFQASYTYSKYEDTGEAQTPGDAPSNDISNPYNPSFDKGASEYDQRHQLTINGIYYFPNPKFEGFLGKLTSGWWTSNIFTAHSGPTFELYVPGGVYANDQNTAGVWDRASYVTAGNLAAALALDPLAQIYNPKTVIVGTPNEWYNPHMFTAPAFGTLGTVGRGGIRAPGLINWDFSIAKDTKLGFLGEAGKVSFRGDIFNVFNHPNFNAPDGQIIGGGPPNADAGVISSTAAFQREIQLSVRLAF